MNYRNEGNWLCGSELVASTYCVCCNVIGMNRNFVLTFSVFP